LRAEIADILIDAISKHETNVRGLGFAGADMGNNSFKWQMVSFILYYAVIKEPLSLLIQQSV
jgi:hypothetical protein